MARVPLSPTQPIESQGVQPGYQSTEGATAAAFGGLQAQSLERSAGAIDALGNKFASDAVEHANRQNAVARARDLGVFSSQAQEALTNLTTEKDMSDPATMAGYTKQLDDLAAKVSDAHTGGPDSKALLAARIAAQRTEFLGHAQGIAATAQEEMVKRAIGDQLNPLTSEAYSNPASIPDLMKRADAVVADMAPGIGVNKAAAMTSANRQLILRSGIQGLMDSGQVDKAADMVNENRALLSPDTQLYFQQHITLARVAQDKAKNATNAIFDSARSILGREPTLPEKKVLLGLAKPDDPDKDPKPTPAATIAAFEKASGKPATQEQIAIAYGLAKPAVSGAGTGTDFGKSLRGRALSFVTDNATAFAHGLLSPDDERRFVASTTQLQSPFQKLNPDTGVLENVTAPLPPFVAEAFQTRGMPLPVLGGPTLPSQGGVPQGAAQPGATPVLQPTQAPQQAGVTPAAPQAAPTLAGNQTIWERNRQGNVTGTVAEATRLLHAAPGIGPMIPGTEMTQAGAAVELATHSLVQALQMNPRYPEAERKDIEKDLNILPKSFDNSTAYAERLISLDDNLAAREAQATKRGADMSLDKDYRQQARNVANLIHNFRDALGVPPVLTPQQADTLPDGAQFRTKDGRVITRRRGAAGAAVEAGTN